MMLVIFGLAYVAAWNLLSRPLRWLDEGRRPVVLYVVERRPRGR